MHAYKLEPLVRIERCTLSGESERRERLNVSLFGLNRESNWTLAVKNGHTKLLSLFDCFSNFARGSSKMGIQKYTQSEDDNCGALPNQ